MLFRHYLIVSIHQNQLLPRELKFDVVVSFYKDSDGWPSLVLSSNNLNECILGVIL